MSPALHRAILGEINEVNNASLFCVIDEAMKRYKKLIMFILAVFLPISFQTSQ